MDFKELSAKLYDIKATGNIKELNKLMNAVEEYNELKETFMEIIDKKPKILTFVLMNRNIKSDFLKKIRESFEETSFGRNIYKNLNHPDKDVKKYFIKQIGMAKSDIFLRVLIDKLKDKEWEVRKEIATILSRLNTEESINVLIGMIDDNDGRVSKDVIERLSEKGNNLLPYFDNYMRMSAPRIKRSIIDILSRIDTFEAMEYIFVLCEDNNDEIRSLAQYTFMLMIDKLDMTSSEKNDKVVFDFIVKQTKKWEPKSFPGLLKVLLRYKEKGAGMVIERLKEKWSMKIDFFSAFNEIKGFERIFLITEMLYSEITEIKAKGFEMLSKYETDEKNIPEVLELIENYVDLKSASMQEDEKKIILGFVMKHKLLETLVKNTRDRDAGRRRKSVKMIGIINDPKISQLLAGCLKDPDSKVRIAVMEVLGEQHDDKFTEIFEDMLNDPDDEVQIKAIEAMAKVKSIKTKEIMFRLIDHPNARIKEIASDIIAKENLKKYIDTFDKLDMKSRETVAKIIEMLGDEAEKIFLSEIQSIDVETRKRTILIIQNMSNKTRFKKVIDEAIKDPDKSVRSMVVALISNIDDRELLIKLVKFLNDPDKRVRANTIEAIGALDSINRQSAVKLITPFAHDKNNRIRANAIIALHRLGETKVSGFIEYMLNDSSELMRASGVFAIGIIRLAEMLPSIEKIMDDDSPMVRKNIIKTLNRIGAKNYILKFISDSDIEVKKTAMEIFKKGGE